MKFGAAYLLWLLWVVPLVALLFIYGAQLRRRSLERFALPQAFVRLQPSTVSSRRGVKKALLLTALLSLVLALVQIQIGYTWEDVPQRGVDLVVALDVSDSMLADDYNEGTTRLVWAKRKIHDLLGMLRGDRIGLVAFAGSAFSQCPLTTDYAAAQLFLDDLSPDSIADKGTAVGDAINVALSIFKAKTADSRALILITDGEDQTQEALVAAQKAQQMGVRIFTMGLGNPDGAPIPDGHGGFRRNDAGELVLSKLDEATLQKIAILTGGAYVRSITSDLDLQTLYERGIKVALTDENLGTTRRQNWHPRFQWFLACALLCLLCESLVSEIGNRRTTRIGS